MIILAAMFMFQAVLVDFIRIKIAERETEDAVKAGLRSTLSGFDRELQKYGLFSLSLPADQEKSLFNEVVGQNLSFNRNGTSDSFSFVDLTLEEDKSKLQHVYSLANQQVLGRQILEDMKYKAPLEYTRNVMKKLTPAKENAQSAYNFMENTVKLEGLIAEREDELEEVFEQSFKLSSRMKDFHQKYRTKLRELQRISDRLSDDGGEGEQREEEREQERKDREKYAQIRSQISSELNSDHQELLEIKDLLFRKLESAAEMDQRVHEEVQRIQQQQAGMVSAKDEVFAHIELLGHAYFDSFRAEASAVISSFGSFLNRFYSLEAGQDSWTEIYSFNDRYYNLAQEWYTSRSREWQTRQARVRDLKKRQKDEEDKAKEQMEEIKKASVYSACRSTDSEWYKQLEGKHGYYQTYLQLNHIEKGLKTLPSAQLDDSASKFGNQSLSFLEEMMEGLEQIRNELFVNEYALIQFNYGTFEKDMQNGKLVKSMSEPGQHKLLGQEVEYILYGLSSCVANRSAAYTELFMIRLAVRTAEALTDPKKMATGSPLLVLLTALAEGATNAYSDMTKLMNGEDVPFSSRFSALQLNYRDYLRLFLFVHSNEQRKLARIQSLLQLNTGQNLARMTTYIKANASTSLHLWFLPGIMRMMEQTSAVNGRVIGNRYLIRKSASLSY